MTPRNIHFRHRPFLAHIREKVQTLKRVEVSSKYQMSTAASSSSSSSTLLVAARASILHKQVTVELINGLRLTGRIVQFDPETMNVKLDSITSTELIYRTQNHSTTAELLFQPPHLPPMHSVALRGNSIKWLDIAHDEPSGAAASVEAAVRLVRAGGLIEG